MQGIPMIFGVIRAPRMAQSNMKKTLMIKVILKNRMEKGTVPIESSSMIADGM